MKHDSRTLFIILRLTAVQPRFTLLFFFTVDFLDITKGKGLVVTVKVRYHRPGFVVSRFFSTALLGRKISFVIPRNSLFIEVSFTSRFHGLSSV